MNLEQFNIYFSENYDDLRVLSLRIVRDKDKSVDLLHKSYESISNVLRKRDLDNSNIKGYISRTIKNWSRNVGTNSDKFNNTLVKCENIFTNERLHETEESEPDVDVYQFKRKIDDYLLQSYPLKESALFKLKFVYGYTYDMITDYTQINRATAHQVISAIHKDLKQKFNKLK